MDPTHSASSTSQASHFHIDNGLLKYKSRIVISPHSHWKLKLLEEHHSTLAASHQGVLKTYHRLKRSFYWPGMKGDIKLFISECPTCQQHKYETIAPPGLLQPLSIPERIWTNINIDFIVGLPLSKGKFVIMVVVDRLSKYAHFIPLAYPYTATTVTHSFLENVFKLHGLPSTIVSDRDPIFLSTFSKEIFKLQGSKLCMSSGYHPQSDGQTEVVNRCLETYHRCFVSFQPKKWTIWLPWAEWCYNTSYHSSSKFTPFELVYGHTPYVTPYERGTARLEVVEHGLLEHCHSV